MTQLLSVLAKAGKLPVAAIPRARTLGETDGLFKVVIAMKTGQEYTFLRDFIFTHPSMSEALNDLMNL